jgi:hypothetical protein
LTQRLGQRDGTAIADAVAEPVDALYASDHFYSDLESEYRSRISTTISSYDDGSPSLPATRTSLPATGGLRSLLHTFVHSVTQQMSNDALASEVMSGLSESIVDIQERLLTIENYMASLRTALDGDEQPDIEHVFTINDIKLRCVIDEYIKTFSFHYYKYKGPVQVEGVNFAAEGNGRNALSNMPELISSALSRNPTLWYRRINVLVPKLIYIPIHGWDNISLLGDVVTDFVDGDPPTSSSHTGGLVAYLRLSLEYVGDPSTTGSLIGSTVPVSQSEYAATTEAVFATIDGMAKTVLAKWQYGESFINFTEFMNSAFRSGEVEMLNRGLPGNSTFPVNEGSVSYSGPFVSLSVSKSFGKDPANDRQSTDYTAVRDAFGVYPYIYRIRDEPVGKHDVYDPAESGAGTPISTNLMDAELGLERTGVNVLENWHLQSYVRNMDASKVTAMKSGLSAATLSAFPDFTYKATFFSLTDEHKEAYSGNNGTNEVVFIRHDHAGKLWTVDTSNLELIVNESLGLV